MIRACTIMMVLSTTICSISAYAEQSAASPDVYNQCVEQTIEKLALGSINNAVVESCSNQSRAYYEKEIVKVLDQIKKQSQIDHQQERYTDIMKSQRLWKAYVDQECQNTGSYIGLPMYAFCPMQEYGKRLDQLTEYAH